MTHVSPIDHEAIRRHAERFAAELKQPALATPATQLTERLRMLGILVQRPDSMNPQEGEVVHYRLTVPHLKSPNDGQPVALRASALKHVPELLSEFVKKHDHQPMIQIQEHRGFTEVGVMAGSALDTTLSAMANHQAERHLPRRG
jgi:hypothetical protein